MLITFREHLKKLNSKGRRIAGTSLFFAALIYLYRAQSDEFWLTGLSAGFICIFSLPVLLGLFIWFGLHIRAVIQYAAEAAESRLGVIIPTLVIVLVFFLPVPPLQERTLFLSHQEEYATLAQLALSGQLSHDDHCKAANAFAPPKGYEQLAGDCVFTDGMEAAEFTPYTFYVAISYFAEPDNPTISSWCNTDGFVWDKIDSHWYICKRDFN